MALRGIIDLSELACTRSIGLVNAAAVRDEGTRTSLTGSPPTPTPDRMKARCRSKHAELLSKLPLFLQAAIDGTIGAAHIAVLAKALTKSRIPYAIRDEQVLLNAAVTMNVSTFTETISVWVSHCDDAVTAPDSEDEKQDERRFQLAQMSNGMWHAEGLLEPLTGSRPQRRAQPRHAKTITR